MYAIKVSAKLEKNYVEVFLKLAYVHFLVSNGKKFCEKLVLVESKSSDMVF